VPLAASRAREATLHQEDPSWSTGRECTLNRRRFQTPHRVGIHDVGLIVQFAPARPKPSAGARRFSDQSPLFSDRKLSPTYFNWSELRRHIESANTLKAGIK